MGECSIFKISRNICGQYSKIKKNMDVTELTTRLGISEIKHIIPYINRKEILICEQG